MQLSKYFTEFEFLFSATARSLKIDNSWESPVHKANAIKLCNEVLDPIREKYGAIKITSGYRSKQLNKAIYRGKKEVTNSKHLTGEAADIRPLNPNVTLKEMYEFLNKTHKGGLAMKAGQFIHIDIGPNRRWVY